MERTVFTKKGNIQLLYAENEDRKLIYSMAFEEEAIWRAMIKKKEDFIWDTVKEEAAYFFGSDPGASKYLLIQFLDEIAGVISHTFNDGKIVNFELDIWLRSLCYTSKGIGPAAIKMLIERLIADYDIHTFIIRPWRHNQRAVRAYEKCGFKEQPDFQPADYYGQYLELYGDGDFGKEETVNMVLKM